MPLNHQLSPTMDVTDLCDGREPGIKVKHHSITPDDALVASLCSYFRIF